LGPMFIVFALVRFSVQPNARLAQIVRFETIYILVDFFAQMLGKIGPVLVSFFARGETIEMRMPNIGATGTASIAI